MLKTKLQEYFRLDLDNVFETFYDTMLSSEDFSVFFKDDEQIRSLIMRQKAFLLETILLDDDVIRTRYIKLGELHYDLEIPYIDYMAGVNILERGIIYSITDKPDFKEQLNSTFDFFSQVRAFTARGYLNKMLDADIEDIQLYLSHVNRVTEIDTMLATERIIWLKKVLYAIKVEDRSLAPNLDIPEAVMDTISNVMNKDEVLLKYTTEIAGRMETNARNVFFFLEKGSYEEVLPLYRELMSIYKLTLMLTSVVTITVSDTLAQTMSKDPLTGLLTRHTYDTIMGRELSIAAAGKYELSFIMVDVDNFKKTNDDYGHAAGDEVLSKIAKILSNSIRATDYAYRMGGDEFLLILKGASETVALTQAENMREQIEAVEFKSNGSLFSITASFGISTYNQPFDLDYNEMVEAADQNLFTAKKKGRNRII